MSFTISYSLSIYLLFFINVLFFKHTSFFYIHNESHNVSKFEFVHIDYFLDDTYSFHTNIGTLIFLLSWSFLFPYGYS